VPALADPRNLVLTAASADQPSFGCGPDADITWFGRALLVEALNADADPVAAFNLASTTVAAREAEQEYDASNPQIVRAPHVETAWSRWRAALAPGPTIAFEPWSPQATTMTAN
jgi:hypothetical protein